MAVFFLLLAFLLVVVVGAAGLENTDPSSATLFDRSFSQLSEGQLLVLAAALGFLVALFLFLAFGASRTRRSRRKELKSRRRDAEGRVDELERENARLKQELEGVDRDRSDAVAERDRAEATVDRVRSDADARREPAEAASLAHDPTGATAVDEQVRADSRAAATPPEPTNVRRERLDDRTGIPPAHDEHARAAADEEAPRR
jgi:septal ring factor EnvC (AmiA/AmiB activator)